MKVFLSVEDITAEIKVDGNYQPDVLTDICHRATELVTQQRITSLVVEVEDSE